MSVPATASYAQAQDYARSLGLDPRDVTEITIRPRALEVWTFDRDETGNHVLVDFEPQVTQHWVRWEYDWVKRDAEPTPIHDQLMAAMSPDRRWVLEHGTCGCSLANHALLYPGQTRAGDFNCPNIPESGSTVCRVCWACVP